MSVVPSWLPPSRYWQAQLPRQQRAWLLSRGSLTHFLKILSANHFRVEVVFQGWQRPQPNERYALQLKPHEWAFVREVQLWGQDAVWIQARSVIPHKTLRGQGQQLRYLGNRSLGSILFKAGGRREAPELQQQSGIWCRRSRFWFAGQPLLVQEIFLPALFAAADTSKPVKLY